MVIIYKSDIIIALAHLGLDEGKVVNSTLIAETGEHDKKLGYVDLYIEDGMTYQFDVFQPPNERITENLIGDEKLDKD